MNQDETACRHLAQIFAEHTPRDRELLLRATAERWYGAG